LIQYFNVYNTSDYIYECGNQGEQKVGIAMGLRHMAHIYN
jgi:hypothetical protein